MRVQNLGPKPESMYGYQLGVLLMTLGAEAYIYLSMVAELQNYTDSAFEKEKLGEVYPL